MNREQMLDDVAEIIEVDLKLIGCTAIEDKLQEGVPRSIELMAEANINIWVLTGDKMETAINIGYACSLLTNEQRKFVIDAENDRILEAEATMNKTGAIEILNEEVMSQLEKAYDDAKLMSESMKFALVIDGKALQVALQPENQNLFRKLGMMCAAVVCCRVSPLQKADVTLLVKEGASMITLSIGDGANDVSMIQSAHIGVGISGNEGMQAVMASDSPWPSSGSSLTCFSSTEGGPTSESPRSLDTSSTRTSCSPLPSSGSTASLGFLGRGFTMTGTSPPTTCSSPVSLLL